MTTKAKPKAEDRITELEAEIAEDAAALLEAIRLADTQPGVSKEIAARVAAKYEAVA